MRWTCPSARSLASSKNAGGCRLEHCAAFLTPGLKKAVEALGRIAVLQNTLPATTDPRPETISWERFEEVDEIALQRRMSLHENRQTCRARWFGVEAVTADGPAAHGYEDLRPFRRGQALEICFEPLHRELAAEE